jgi:hypothetical protein
LGKGLFNARAVKHMPANHKADNHFFPAAAYHHSTNYIRLGKYLIAGDKLACYGVVYLQESLGHYISISIEREDPIITGAVARIRVTTNAEYEAAFGMRCGCTPWGRIVVDWGTYAT